MDRETDSADGNWRALAGVAALIAPMFAVLWLGITLTNDCNSFALAIAKIVFTIVAVGTGIAGIRWTTAAGVALLAEALVVVAWIALKVETYPPHGAMRTGLLLAAPLGTSGIMFVLSGGIKAGTWPPARFRRTGQA